MSELLPTHADLVRALSSDRPHARRRAELLILHSTGPIATDLGVQIASLVLAGEGESFLLSEVFDRAESPAAVLDHAIERWNAGLPVGVTMTLANQVVVHRTEPGLRWLRTLDTDGMPEWQASRIAAARLQLADTDTRQRWWASASPEERAEAAFSAELDDFITWHGAGWLDTETTAWLLGSLECIDPDRGDLDDPRDTMQRLDRQRPTLLTGALAAWTAGPTAFRTWLGDALRTLDVTDPQLIERIDTEPLRSMRRRRLDAMLTQAALEPRWPTNPALLFALGHLVEDVLAPAIEVKWAAQELDGLATPDPALRRRLVNLLVDQLDFRVQTVTLRGQHEEDVALDALKARALCAVLLLHGTRHPRDLLGSVGAVRDSFEHTDTWTEDTVLEVLRPLGKAGIQVLAHPSVPLRALVRVRELLAIGTPQACQALDPGGVFEPLDDEDAFAIAVLTLPDSFPTHIDAWRRTGTGPRARVLQLLDEIHETSLWEEAQRLGRKGGGRRR